VYYYCNISSPFVFDNNCLKYIDYDLDVKVFPDMTHALLDEDEYEQHRLEMNYPEVIDKILQRNVKTLVSWIEQRRGPFAPDFIESWTNRYILLSEIQANKE